MRGDSVRRNHALFSRCRTNKLSWTLVFAAKFAFVRVVTVENSSTKGVKIGVFSLLPGAPECHTGVLAPGNKQNLSSIVLTMGYMPNRAHVA